MTENHQKIAELSKAYLDVYKELQACKPEEKRKLEIKLIEIGAAKQAVIRRDLRENGRL